MQKTFWYLIHTQSSLITMNSHNSIYILQLPSIIHALALPTPYARPMPRPQNQELTYALRINLVKNRQSKNDTNKSIKTFPIVRNLAFLFLRNFWFRSFRRVLRLRFLSFRVIVVFLECMVRVTFFTLAMFRKYFGDLEIWGFVVVRENCVICWEEKSSLDGVIEMDFFRRDCWWLCKMFVSRKVAIS